MMRFFWKATQIVCQLCKAQPHEEPLRVRAAARVIVFLQTAMQIMQKILASISQSLMACLWTSPQPHCQVRNVNHIFWKGLLWRMLPMHLLRVRMNAVSDAKSNDKTVALQCGHVQRNELPEPSTLGPSCRTILVQCVVLPAQYWLDLNTNNACTTDIWIQQWMQTCVATA